MCGIKYILSCLKFPDDTSGNKSALKAQQQISPRDCKKKLLFDRKVIHKIEGTLSFTLVYLFRENRFLKIRLKYLRVGHQVAKNFAENPFFEKEVEWSERDGQDAE